jgi:hypothetical protein
MHVPLCRIRVTMLALLVVMLVGSVVVATASAEAGPFWHHRAIGGKGEGEKIESKAPENFRGTGSVQTFDFTISTTAAEVQSLGGVQVKGAIFNGAHQGQFKLETIYLQPTLIKPVLTGCGVTVNTNNIVQVKGHLAWKWNGTQSQLEEQPQANQTPDLIVTNVEPQEQEVTKPLDYRKVGVFATVTFKGAGCGVLAGTFNVGGSEVGLPNRKLEEFSTKLTIRTLPDETLKEELAEKPLEGFLQHVWVGKKFQPLVLGLRFGENLANLIGQTEVESAQQEVAVFEK